MDFEHYNDFYTTEDFILDEEFRKIVRDPDLSLYLKRLKNTFPEKKKEIDTAIQILTDLRPGMIRQSEKRKHELWQQIRRSYTKRFVISRYWVAAASFFMLVAIGSGILMYKMYRRPQKPMSVASVESPFNETRLVLANGKSISIASKHSTVQYTADGSGVKVNDSSEVAQKVPKEGLNKLIVPYGKRSYVILADGTRVWINSGSKLIYPPAFSGKSREVFLEGEAFFDVAKDKTKPFFVKTDLFRTKVYGTRFNVQAYLLDQEYSIVLVEGKIGMSYSDNLQAKELFLEPSERASISRATGTFEVHHVENTAIYTEWINGYLTFVNEDVSDVLKRVSRYYNVEIDCRLPANYEKIYGKLDLKDNLERVLDGIAFISKTNYQKEGNTYCFYE